eukprot:SAG11_NODE_16409_length_548_cov_0.768374_1_plen_172_part_01
MFPGGEGESRYDSRRGGYGKGLGKGKYGKGKSGGRQVTESEPLLYKVYRGEVSGLMRMGCFVSLSEFPGKVEGLVHVSQIREGARLNEPSEAVRRGQRVWVKVIGKAASKLSLSMRDVDQQSGFDNRPMTESAAHDDAASNPSRPANGATLSGVTLTEEDRSADQRRPAKRL